VEISPRRTRRARRGKELIINTLRALRVLRGENGLLVAALLRCGLREPNAYHEKE
jgi:hypothetical protein